MSDLDHGRVECKRCGTVYKPRSSANEIAYGWAMDVGVNMQCGPFKTDRELLIHPVNPKEFCPRCEEHLVVVKKRLVECLTTD